MDSRIKARRRVQEDQPQDRGRLYAELIRSPRLPSRLPLTPNLIGSRGIGARLFSCLNANATPAQTVWRFLLGILGKVLLENRGIISKFFLPSISVFLLLILFTSQANAISEAASGFNWPLPYTNLNTSTNNEYCSGGWCNNGGNYFGEYDAVSYASPVYHPAEDWNLPGIPGGYATGCSSDKGLDVVATANGNVVYANTSDWGGIVIKHIYQGETWYSQYGHIFNAIVTVGQDVNKGQKIAEIGNVGTQCAHLHFEIRNTNHPNPTYGAYWTYGSAGLGNNTNVNNWYEDPDAFIPAHPAYTTLLPAPSLSSPTNGATNQSTTPTFSWSLVSGADKYWIMVATNPSYLPTDPAAISCPSCIITGSTSSTSHTPPNQTGFSGTTTTLNPNTTYYWQIQAFNNATNGYYSSQWSFTTASAADTTPPTVDAFNVTPPTLTLGNSFTISYTVSDTGGSGLNRVELWRANDNSGSPVGWAEITRTSLSGNGPSSGSFYDPPSSTGTYWYGVHPVDNTGNWNDEQNSNTGNLPGDYGPIQVTVTALALPDLVVINPNVSDATLTPGQSFTINATVKNQGNGSSSSTTLRYYRSTNSTISTGDTPLGTDPVSALSPNSTSPENLATTAPATDGTYWVGACVDAVSGESPTNNQCSSGVQITVTTVLNPDLVVINPIVNDATPAPGDPFTINATVKNQGNGSSGNSTLRYYRSTDSIITTSDTQLGTDTIPGLSPNATSPQSISVSAPATDGTYWIGACVDAVSGESLTNNQCSSGKQITVTSSGQSFLDVPPSHWAYQWIEALAASSIATGCGGGNFCPEMIATRDLAAIWLWKARNNPVAPPVASGKVYNDVADTDFAADYILGVKNDAITEGCDASNYCPKQVLTKAQAAKMLLKAANIASVSGGTAVYDDVPDGHFAEDWIRGLKLGGYTGGCGGNNYCPDEALTLGGFAKMLAKTFGLVP